MSGFPNGFAGENGYRPYGYLSNNIPRSFHRQPDSPEGGNSSSNGKSSAGGGHFHLTQEDPSFNTHDDDDFAFLAPRPQPYAMDSTFLQHGASNTHYGDQGANTRAVTGTPGTLGFSDIPSHTYPTHYSSMYHPSISSSNSHYTSGLSQGVTHSLPMDTRGGMLHASSPSGSEGSYEDAGSAYSSPSMTPLPVIDLPLHHETEAYLRRTLDIKPGQTVDLSFLSEPTERKQPPITHMIKLAIWGSRYKRLTLRQIYDEIEKRYPALRDLEDKPWQRSIRHNLSLKAIFVRVERPANEPGKGHYWAIDFRQGEGNKRDRKRKEPLIRGSFARYRSDEEEEFSEEMDEDRPSLAVGSKRYGDRRGALPSHRMHQNQYDQYSGGSSIGPETSIHSSSRMGYPTLPPPPRYDPYRTSTYPSHPTSRSSTLSELQRANSLPSNIEYRPIHGRNNNNNNFDTPYLTGIHDPVPLGAYMHQGPITLPSMSPSPPPQPQISYIGSSSSSSPFGHSSCSRRPAPDDDEEDHGRRNRHRAH